MRVLRQTFHSVLKQCRGGRQVLLHETDVNEQIKGDQIVRLLLDHVVQDCSRLIHLLRLDEDSSKLRGHLQVIGPGVQVLTVILNRFFDVFDVRLVARRAQEDFTLAQRSLCLATEDDSGGQQTQQEDRDQKRSNRPASPHQVPSFTARPLFSWRKERSSFWNSRSASSARPWTANASA